MKMLPETALGLVVGRNYLPPPARSRARRLFSARELTSAGCWIMGAMAFGVALGMMFYG
jgi:hypothetical protein